MIALIAHDAQKDTLLHFVGRRRDFFAMQRLVATGNTGRMLQEKLGLEVERVAHGPSGGDLIIGGRVAEGQIQAVLFLRDPLTAQPHEPDVAASCESVTCTMCRWLQMSLPPQQSLNI